MMSFIAVLTALKTNNFDLKISLLNKLSLNSVFFATQCPKNADFGLVKVTDFLVYKPIR